MVKELEVKMWEAAKTRDKEAFLEVVDENAVMVCGGYRCLGREYAQIIHEFDCSGYEITDLEEVVHTENVCQVHYVIKTEVSCNENQDLAGKFHITSTWMKQKDKWKLVFNMDSRIIE